MTLHRDTVDLLVTAYVADLDTESAHAGHALIETTDAIGQILTDALAEARTTQYAWQPVSELLAPALAAEFLLQVERSRLAFIERASRRDGWRTSPARQYIDELGASIRRRLGRGGDDRYQQILTSEELERTVDDWRRPTIHTSPALADPQEGAHG